MLLMDSHRHLQDIGSLLRLSKPSLALSNSGVHPAKAAPHLRPPVRLAYGGRELEHNGRYDILPWDPDRMTWIRSSGGKPPQGWENKVVEGGYENGGKLWHARTEIGGVMVPGKTGVHLGGANFAFGGEEVVKREEYDVLCWR
ncbi:hypothetical protein BT69DRAFT_1010121 [Atractiella rhizophila]|nr:hypothetical protein BT69DRAFT_1010121 [Atractiella rhizophila]